MTLQVPERLNKEFISACLQGEEKCGETIDVIKFTPLPVVPEGNNYGSSLLRVTVDFMRSSDKEIQSKSLIIKSPLTGSIAADLLDALKDVEPAFYHQFMPLAKQLNSDYFAPKCYFSPDPSVVVLEDLKEQGYLMADRCAQLDYDHCRLYAIASATFHAVSIAVYKVDAELVESLGKEKLFSEELNSAELQKSALKQGLECTSDYMEKTELKKYANLVRNAESFLYDKLIEAHKLREGLQSLHQGDPWTTNMMFRYDDSGKVSEVKLLDFQALRYGSPINDLVFFLWTSANNDVRENRREDFFHIYCDTLNSRLHDLNCSESLSYDDLLKSVEALWPLMFFVAVSSAPLMLSPTPVDLADLSSNEEDENGKPVNKVAKYYTQYYCDNFLSKYLRQLDCMGAFKYLEGNA